MGIIRKTASISSLGAIKYRSVREQKAHAARTEAKAAKVTAQASRDAARAAAFTPNSADLASAWDAGFAAGYRAATSTGASEQNPHR